MNAKDLSFPGFVKQVIEALEEVAIEYMIGGALAVWAWGEPRSTMDLDLVVDLPFDAIRALSSELKKRGMWVPEDIILNNLLEDRADSAINAIHPTSGLKAELFPLREGDTLRRSAFERRRLVNLGPELGEVYVHSPEDLIIYKMLYFSLSQQTKHPRDILSILRARQADLDLEYIESWVDQLNLSSIWKDLWAEARN